MLNNLFGLYSGLTSFAHIQSYRINKHYFCPQVNSYWLFAKLFPSFAALSKSRQA